MSLKTNLQEQFYISFTDLLALLLVFFIYLITMDGNKDNGLTKMNDNGGAQAQRVALLDSIGRLNNHMLFDVGSFQLTVSAQARLIELAELMQGASVRLIISGHADPRPIHQSIIQSNWHLSAMRSASVTHYLQQHGVMPHQLSIEAYGDTQHNNHDDSFNRRVDIQLEEL